MDIEEWEFLSDDGFLDFNESGGNQNFLGRRKFESKSALDMNYFFRPSSPNSSKITESPPRNPPRVPNQLIPVPIQLEPKTRNVLNDGLVKEITENQIIASQIRAAPMEATDQDTVSQLFFKIKENEFVDMKMDSPKSGVITRGLLLPPIDAGTLKFEDKEGEGRETITTTSPKMKLEKEMLNLDSECDKEDDSSGFNFWKWSSTGVGAICSFGVAAATICVLFFRRRQRNKLHQDEKIRVQILTDEKRNNQVVIHATKLNEAISTVRGIPPSRAHITVGGYSDGL